MSLIGDYEDLLHLVREHEVYSRRFGLRVTPRMSVYRGALKGIQGMRSPYSRPQALIDLYREVANEQEKSDPQFDVLTAGSPAEALADRFLAKHPRLQASDARGLAELHRLHSTQHAKSTPGRMLAVVLSVAAVVGRTVPKEVVDQLGWISYERYLFGLTIFTLATATYVLLVVASVSHAMRRSAPRQGVELVIVLIEARLGRATLTADPISVDKG